MWPLSGPSGGEALRHFVAEADSGGGEPSTPPFASSQPTGAIGGLVVQPAARADAFEVLEGERRHGRTAERAKEMLGFDRLWGCMLNKRVRSYRCKILAATLARVA